MKNRETIVENYVEGYNSFDVIKMMADFSENIVFENIQNGEITMTLNGLEAFKTQAEAAKNYFSQRQQTIRSFRHEGQQTKIEIEFFGVLAIDFPNGMTKGQEIKLVGRSIFEFKNHKIVRLTDVS